MTTSSSLTRELLSLAIIFIFSASILWSLITTLNARAIAYDSATSTSATVAAGLPGLPHSLDDVRVWHAALTHISLSQPYLATITVSYLYVFKQMWSIPGSAVLNVLVGAIYGHWGWPLACTLTCLGASLCFLLSGSFLSGLAHRLLGDRLERISTQVQAQREKQTLLFYLFFIRLFPASPNFFFNLASPHVKVPLHMFALSVFVGLAPYNWACVEAGTLLASLTSTSDIIDSWMLARLLGVSLVVLLPAVFKDKLQAWAKVS